MNKTQENTQRIQGKRYKKIQWYNKNDTTNQHIAKYNIREHATQIQRMRNKTNTTMYTKIQNVKQCIQRDTRKY